ncbi:MAG: hypothetical protein U9N73_01915 [Candidatus Auribacterota bacterium]|nr:hypothetical protein [Candidatus Auribacterota bacterium]
MKAIDWSRYLEEQRREHGKSLFTITELANVARTSIGTINVELSRLRKYGVVERYARGIYGLPGIKSPEVILPELDSHAYITGGSALFFHNLISQVPVQITSFTDRRHGNARVRITPLGAFRFVSVKAPIYAPPKDGVIAGAEQALCDFVYLSRRDGTDPMTQVSFRNLDRISSRQLSEVLKHYPRTVGKQIHEELSLVL